jgi:hypothetical protein
MREEGRMRLFLKFISSMIIVIMIDYFTGYNLADWQWWVMIVLIALAEMIRNIANDIT